VLYPAHRLPFTGRGFCERFPRPTLCQLATGPTRVSCSPPVLCARESAVCTTVCMLILSHGLIHLPSPRRAPGLFGPASFARALFTNGVVRGVLRGSLPLGHAQHIEGYTLWIGKLAAHNVFGAQERWVGCSSNYTWRPPRRLANLPLGTPLQRTSRRVVHVGPGRSHRPFFLPLFTQRRGRGVLRSSAQPRSNTHERRSSYLSSQVYYARNTRPVSPRDGPAGVAAPRGPAHRDKRRKTLWTP
jgi:hypothetical protein